VAAFGHDVCEENVCAVFRSGEHTCGVVERVTNVGDDACKRHILLGGRGWSGDWLLWLYKQQPGDLPGVYNNN